MCLLGWEDEKSSLVIQMIVIFPVLAGLVLWRTSYKPYDKSFVCLTMRGLGLDRTPGHSHSLNMTGKPDVAALVTV